MADFFKERLSLLQIGEARGKLTAEQQAELDRYKTSGVIKGAGVAQKADDTINDMRHEVTQLKSDLANARTLLGKTTGRLGRVLGASVPVTPAYDFEQSLIPIKSNVALTKLSRLKANSPSGASGFGSLTAPELALLTNALGSLESKQSNEQILRTLDTVERAADRILESTADAPVATSTEDRLQVGGGDNLVDTAAGPDAAERQAAFEAEYRDAYGKGADKPALLAIGAKYKLDLDEAQLDAALVARAGGDKRLNIIMKPTPPTAPPDGRGAGSSLVETLDAGIRGVADVATLGFADEIAALGSTIVNPETTLRANLDRERGVDDYDERNNFGARLTGQIAGGFALPLGATRTPAALGRASAGYGATYGFGSGEGLADRGGQALVGGAAGGALGYGAGRAGQALSARIARGGNGSGGNAVLNQRQALMAAADRQGVQPLPADVGGPFVRIMTGVGAQGPVSAIPIVEAANRVTMQGAAARDRIATAVGTVTEPELAGQLAIAGAAAFTKRTSGQATALYDKARRLAGLSRVAPKNALEVLDENIAELSQAPGGASGVERMRALRKDFEKRGTVTVDGIRLMRSTLRDDFIKDGLRGSDVERRVGQVINAATKDVVQTLTEAGRGEAARAFAIADRYWRDRITTIDNVLAPIVGPKNDKSGEQVIAALQTATKGNAARLAAFVRALPPEEASIVRATMIGQLGRANAGTNNAAGEAFSLGQFLTHWNQMTPGAKRAIFDPASQSALNDLAIIADGSKQASLRANHSNTGAAILGQTILTGGVAVLFDFGTMAAALGSQYGAGRLLASPRFSRWLARAPKHRDPAAHLESLRDLAAKEAAIAPEILGFQQRLTEALQQGPAQLAATDQNDE